jgi:hypothetical protein
MSALPSEPSGFVDTVTTAIVRRVDRYLDALDNARSEGTLRAEEAELLDRFESYTVDVLDRHVPPGPRTKESLAFARLYERRTAVTLDERRRLLLVALMAAEVESRGPFRLTQAQNGRLARIFERIGQDCGREGLLLHAALAYERAAGIYLLLSENGARDQCLYARARYRQQADLPGLRKVMLAVSGTLCGYGYKPYRLLSWVGVQLVLFTIGVVIAIGGSIGHGIYTSLTNYLNPTGGDNLSGVAQVLLVTESYVSTVSLSVFFALVVHRWFRL